MKISSVSKKVLCTALSAATALAFAPTLAFADKAADGTKTVDVTYDANGGKLTSAAVSGQTTALLSEDGKYYIAVPDTQAAANDSYHFYTWFIDADGDGLISEGDTVENDGYIQVSADTTAVTLKAAYDMPTVAFNENLGLENEDYTYGVTNQDAKFMNIGISGLADKGHTYSIKVSCPDGASTTLTADELKDSEGVYFTANPISNDNAAIESGHLTKGEYTVELSDNGKVVSTDKATLVEVTAIEGETTTKTLYMLNGGSAVATLEIPGSTKYKAWLDADGYAVADEDDESNGYQVTVTSDVTFTATENAQAAESLTYDEDDAALVYEVDDAEDASYAVEIVDPSAKTIYTANNVDDWDEVYFGGTATGSRTDATQQAGTYVLKVTATENGTSTESKTKMVMTQYKYDAGEHGSYGKGAVTSYFTDEGSYSCLIGNGEESGHKPKLTIADGYEWAGYSLNGVTGDASALAKAFKEGEVNTLVNLYKAKEYAATPAYTITKKTAGSNVQYVLTVTPAEGTAVEVLTRGAHAEQGTSQDTITKAKAFILDADTQMIELRANSSKADSGIYEKSIYLANVENAGDIWKYATSGSNNNYETYIGKTTTKWLAEEGVAKAIADGKTAFEAMAAKSFVETTEFGSVADSSFKAVYEAVKAVANAQAKAYKDGAYVVVGEKVYAMTAEQIKTITDAVAAADKAIDKEAKKGKSQMAAVYQAQAESLVSTVNDTLKDASPVNIKASDVTAAKAVTDAIDALPTEITSDNADAVIEAAQKIISDYAALSADAKKLISSDEYAKATDALQKAAEASIKAEDIAAAKKVTDEINALTEVSLDNAIEIVQAVEKIKSDYEDLSADAQILVSSADYNKAIQAEDIANGLIAGKVAADSAALDSVKGKTKTVHVKKAAKTKKAVTVKLKNVISESGATASFAKVTGNKNVKIKGNKITLKKGTKKGTYKVKVNVDYGSFYGQHFAKKVTVKFVVKK